MLLNILYVGVMDSVFAVLFYSGNSCCVVFLTITVLFRLRHNGKFMGF